MFRVIIWHGRGRSALVSHAKVAEAAVCLMPHDIKGQGLYAFVTLKEGIHESNELERTPDARSQGDRSYCGPEIPVHTCPAEDAFGQDYEKNIKKDCRE